jgi:Domain of unknown function (DUF4920)
MRFFTLLMAAGIACAATQNLGKPLTLKKPMTIAKVMGKPDKFVGKTVQVKGKVAEVCQMMGCWMDLADGGKNIHIKVDDGVIVFPKDSVGKQAVAEGKLIKVELTKDQAIAQAKHTAEEQGRKFDPASVKGGQTIYQIEGTGAQLLN